MKKLILVLITLFSLSVVTYASFPVTESSAEPLSVLNEIPPVSPDWTGWSVAALCWGILGVLLWMAPLLGTCAIIFGAIGLKKGGRRGMAIAGLILGIIKFIFYLILILYYLLAAATLGAAFGG